MKSHDVAKKRGFDYDFIHAKSVQSMFKNGQTWVAFVRLNGPPHCHLDTVLQRFTSKNTDCIEVLRRAIWVGDHDAEITKLCSVLPAQLDANVEEFRNRLLEQFTPFMHLKFALQSEAQRLVTEQEKVEAAAKELAKEEKEAEALQNQKGDGANCRRRRHRCLVWRHGLCGQAEELQRAQQVGREGAGKRHAERLHASSRVYLAHAAQDF